MIVEGYSFSDRDMAMQARKEAEGVRYVKARTDMSSPSQVFGVYHKLLEQRMFQTPIGYSYLKELQEYLKTMPGISVEEIKPIPVAANLVVDDAAGVSKRLKGRLEQVQKRLRLSRVLNVVFALAILAMFVISATSGQTTILNYESEIQNKYAQWEQQLQEREAKVRERELQLNIEVTDEE